MQKTSVSKEQTVQTAIQLYNQKEYQRAIQVLYSIKADENETVQVFYYLGLCYTNLHEYRDALLCFQQVVLLDKGFLYDYQCHMISGYIYAQLGKYKEAEQEFQELLNNRYDSAKIRSALAYALYQQKQVDRSIEELKKALSIDPLNANALNTLGYIYAAEGIDDKLAVQYCKLAVKQNPSNPAYLDSLAAALMNVNDYEQARAILERASALSKKSRIDIEQRLQQVHEKLNR